MPANLNALIRYKTINSSLYGGKRKWSIPELIERCSAALAEYRGRYDPISERTLRDDIRVMRSDILGYNAPIKQQNGLYYYSDPFYSIMTISLTDSALIDRIIRFLDEIKREVTHPEIEIIHDKLLNLKVRCYTKEEESETTDDHSVLPDLQKYINAGESLKKIKKSVKVKPSGEIRYSIDEACEPMVSVQYATGKPYLLTWGDILVIV